MRRKSLISFFLWFTCSFVYYALTLNVGTLFPGDIYLNFFLSGVIEVPLLPLVVFVLVRFGRRPLLFTGLFLGFLSLVASIFVPEGLSRRARWTSNVA